MLKKYIGSDRVIDADVSLEDIEIKALGEWTPTLEAMELMELRETSKDVKSIYLIFTCSNKNNIGEDKPFEGKSYNHLSMSLDNNPETLFTYNLHGGLEKESIDNLEGNYYSLYAVYVTDGVFKRISNAVNEMVEAKEGLVDTTQRKVLAGFFKGEHSSSSETEELICSRTISKLFSDNGITLTEGDEDSHDAPDFLIRSKLLKFIRRGIVKAEQFAF